MENSSDAHQNENKIKLSGTETDRDENESERKFNVSNEIKRGRKSKVPWNIQLQAYRSKAAELLDKNKKVLPASAAIYDTIPQSFEKTNDRKSDTAKNNTKHERNFLVPIMIYATKNLMSKVEQKKIKNQTSHVMNSFRMIKKG